MNIDGITTLVESETDHVRQTVRAVIAEFLRPEIDRQQLIDWQSMPEEVRREFPKEYQEEMRLLVENMGGNYA
jgi:hypothetical protein